MNAAYWLNTAWMWKCRREARRFREATRSVAETQQAALMEIVQRNRLTDYGKSYRFNDIQSMDEYRQFVPISSYNDIVDFISRIAEGDSDVLTSDPVILFEPTSGSTHGEKLVPYTAPLRRQFHRAISAWIFDLFASRPALREGRAYWSLSPSFGKSRSTAGGIPIGFEDDTAYLGALDQLAIRRTLAVPVSVAKTGEADTFRYITLLHLLRTRDLTLISVWSPTFFTSLLIPLEPWLDRICRDICRGSESPPDSVGGTRFAAGKRRFKGDRHRADELATICRTTDLPSERFRRIWPRLQLISCWTDAAAARYLPQLSELFPEVEIQPKGLTATEGIVSFPLVGRPGAALALRSHFFEFSQWDMRWEDKPPSQQIRLAHELEEGGRYEVFLTTGGGLYRYRLGDVIEVVGFENQCPLVRFVGRIDQVCDLVGEKLGELHVRTVLESVFRRLGVAPGFAMVVPRKDQPPHYCLIIQPVDHTPNDRLPALLAASVHEGLCANPYYRHAVSIGQLAPLDVQLVPHRGPSVWEVYQRQCVLRGRKPGDIKPTALAAWDPLENLAGNEVRPG